MSEGCYVSEIRAFAGNYVPDGWIPCDGRLLDVKNYETLFSVIGTTYGGDGDITFGVPDLQGRVALHQGQGPGLTLRQLGDTGGTPEWALDMTQVPAHTHMLTADTQEASDTDGFNRTVAAPSGGAAMDKDKPYVGDLRIFAANFVPQGWELCDGRLLDIQSHQYLFSLLGDMYGGDGRRTFALPDFRGRTLGGSGQGEEIEIVQGPAFGREKVTIMETDLPGHSHDAFARVGGLSNAGLSHVPKEGYSLSRMGRLPAGIAPAYVAGPPSNVRLNFNAVSTTGGGQPHDICSPMSRC